ncbi:leucyl aminopeptidase family protein [Echinicola vietnamensis]|uniref:Leucyl aminopeptidase n=1 Tax=Echinicola vietnamensis (strain DSM 17526 / LMG 23754 / KMM 6221) TaxID=926556 RepID=L0FUP6_ECHVK|nr:leucyl aminopeptidase [Echinicola vietnamensis]AGA76481.1 leucyl aminopeptidase [Echinicola vietnamensis DSM 17526]
MLTAIRLLDSPGNLLHQSGVIFISSEHDLEQVPVDSTKTAFVKSQLWEKNKSQVHFSSENSQLVFVKAKDHDSSSYQLEQARKAGAASWKILKETEKPRVFYFGKSEKLLLAFLEGVVLASYKFSKYKSSKGQAPTSLEVCADITDESSLEELVTVCLATFVARDLVNEPVIYLNAEQLGNEIEKLGKSYGFSTEILDESKISSLKMEGLLAVNAGSELPPTFSVMHYKPSAGKKFKKPVVLVGKGVVYDTGGLSLKPTPNSMDFMKADMAGAAAVIGTLCAVAKLGLPVEVIGLVPATDNRPGYNAITPGDIITYPNGKSVEILNTDAEGRLILADALIYASKYDPKLVIDLATLTGAAAAALGKEGAVMMGNAYDEEKGFLKIAGKEVCERLVEFPLWEEYGDQLKSSVADIANIGGPTAGAITAGKFLEHFTDYNWIHIDIAGPSFIKTGESYKPTGGTGFGVRLVTQFLKNISN